MKKRETNKERVSREVKRRSDLIMAKSLAYVIRNLRMVKMTGTKRALEFTEQNCATVGSMLLLCSEEEVPSILRLVADTFEGKPTTHGRTLRGYDGKVTSAYLEACKPLASFPPAAYGPVFEPPLISELVKGWAKLPSFSEFLHAFREKNPRMKVQDRVLRRTLQRMGYSMRPDKRGRPKEK